MSTRHASKKASSSPLYREIELMMVWLIGVGNRVPKGNRMLMIVAEHMMESLMDALVACASALMTSDQRAKMEYLCAMKTDMTLVQTSVNIMFEWSSQEGQSVRVVNPKQHASFLRSMTSIGSQMAGWMASIERKLSETCDL